MKFCRLCNNMLYMRSEDNVQLQYYCKNCNFSEVEADENLAQPITDLMLASTQQGSKVAFMDNSIKYDVTLPRVNSIICKNPKCTKRPEDDNEVIYIKHDPVQLKFMYFCCKCEHYF